MFKIELLDNVITYSIRPVSPDELNSITGIRVIFGLLYFKDDTAYLVQKPGVQGVSLEQLGLALTTLGGGYAQKVRIHVDMLEDDPHKYITQINTGFEWGIRPDYADRWCDAFKRGGILIDRG